MKNYSNKYPDVLNVTEVAQILRVTPATVRRHIKAGEIPSIKAGRIVRIPKDALIAYLHGGNKKFTKNSQI